jgi:hypothetical protein
MDILGINPGLLILQTFQWLELQGDIHSPDKESPTVQNAICFQQKHSICMHAQSPFFLPNPHHHPVQHEEQQIHLFNHWVLDKSY